MESILRKIENEAGDLKRLNGTPKRMIGFPASIYERLPRILSDGCKLLTTEAERAVFLVSGLGVISGMLPKVYGTYDKRIVYPNLYAYILAPYGTGKGAAMFARELATRVHRDKRERTKKEREQYQTSTTLHDTEVKKWKKNKSGEPPQKPAEPQEYMHLIPANNSKTGFFELLALNEGAGTLFETEGDTLADAIRQDYGNYSDGLRKGFHHEPIDYYRRLNSEYKEILQPRISVVLASTFDQLLSLIPSTENGLFSRFIFYELPTETGFKNVFETSKTDIQQCFQRLGDSMAEIYNALDQHPIGFDFRLTDQQQADFLKYFQSMKSEIQEEITTDLDGTIHRLGLIFFRIAMIITSLRNDISQDSPALPPTLICSNADFDLTTELIKTIKHNAISVYLKLPQPSQSTTKHHEKAEQVRKTIELYQSGKSYREISKMTGIPQTTVYRWINYDR